MSGLRRLTAEAARAGALMRRLQEALAPAWRASAAPEAGPLLGGDARLDRLTRGVDAASALEDVIHRLGVTAGTPTDAESPARRGWRAAEVEASAGHGLQRRAQEPVSRARRGAGSLALPGIAGPSPTRAEAPGSPRHRLAGMAGAARTVEARASRRASLGHSSDASGWAAARGERAGWSSAGLGAGARTDGPHDRLDGAGGASSDGDHAKSKVALQASDGAPKLRRFPLTETAEPRPSPPPDELVSPARASQKLRERAGRIHALGAFQSVIAFGPASRAEAAHEGPAGPSSKAASEPAVSSAPRAMARGTPPSTSRAAAADGTPTQQASGRAADVDGSLSGLRRLAALATESLDAAPLETERSQLRAAPPSVEEELNRLLRAEALRHGVTLGDSSR